jgi:hypothetical protein
VRQRESAVVAKSAPDASTKPLARALCKFAAQRDCLTISVIQTGSSQKVEPGRTVLHVLCQTSPSTHLPWRVLRRQVYRNQDRRCTFICSTIIEHRKAYAAIRCLPSADKSSTMELHSLPVISPPTRSAMIFLRAQPSRSKLEI